MRMNTKLSVAAQAGEPRDRGLAGRPDGLDGDAEPIEVSINQFYGIEINDFAVSVAKTALWIAEEQMMEAT